MIKEELNQRKNTRGSGGPLSEAASLMAEI